MSSLNRYRPIFRKVDPQLDAWHKQLEDTLDDLYTKVGSKEPVKIDSVEPLAPSQPSPASLAVIATTGVGFKVQITNPQQVQPASMQLARAKILSGANAPLTPILHNLQSASDTNFDSASGLIDHGISNQTVWTIPMAGVTLYWRWRSSYDGQNWNPWQVYAGPAGPIGVSS